MDEDPTPEELHQAITSSLGELPPEFHFIMMYNFFSVAESIGFENLYPRLIIVMDTNQIMSYIMARARNRSHALDELLHDEYAYISAPIEIETEVYRHLGKMRKHTGVKESGLLHIWNVEIKPRLDLQSNLSQYALDEATVMLGESDPDDIPFLALHLDLGADIILSKDNHIRDVMDDCTWTPPHAKWAAIRVREGVVSLFALHPIGTTASKALAMIAWVILDSLYWLMKWIGSIIEEGVSAFIEWVSGLPDWLKALMVGGAIFAILNYGEEIGQWIERNVTRLIEWIEHIRPYLEGCIEWICKWSKIIGGLLMLLLKSILTGSEELIVLRY